MKPLEPGYGETPVSPEGLSALTPLARDLLGSTPQRAALYDLEQGIQNAVSAQLIRQVLDGERELDQLLSDAFLRELHRSLYAEIWTWGGLFRVRELNIGVPPEMVAVEVRGTLDNLYYRWKHANNLTARALGIEAHASLVRIHPFADGNGRVTRLLADLLFLAAQTDELQPSLYDWDVDKAEYISHLREYDRSRDSSELAEWIPVRPVSV